MIPLSRLVAAVLMKYHSQPSQRRLSGHHEREQVTSPESRIQMGSTTLGACTYVHVYMYNTHNIQMYTSSYIDSAEKH